MECFTEATVILDGSMNYILLEHEEYRSVFGVSANSDAIHPAGRSLVSAICEDVNTF